MCENIISSDESYGTRYSLYLDKNNIHIIKLFLMDTYFSGLSYVPLIIFLYFSFGISLITFVIFSFWIEKQERPLCFQISSFTSSSKNKEDEKVRPS